jgi:hypothetical protein
MRRDASRAASAPQTVDTRCAVTPKSRPHRVDSPRSQHATNITTQDLAEMTTRAADSPIATAHESTTHAVNSPTLDRARSSSHRRLSTTPQDATRPSTTAARVDTRESTTSAVNSPTQQSTRQPEPYPGELTSRAVDSSHRDHPMTRPPVESTHLARAIRRRRAVSRVMIDVITVTSFRPHPSPADA